MSIVYMVGAGASCAGPGIIGPTSMGAGLTPGNPPLGGGLIHALRKWAPQNWTSEIDEFFLTDELNFEQSMAELYNTMWLSGTDQQKTDFNYCVYRMVEFFSNWHLADESNYYSRFVYQLLEWGGLSQSGPNREVAFVSLNYERLLEWAIRTCGVMTAFTSRDYPSSQARVPVWKPHGSCHFLASVAPGYVGRYPRPSDLNGEVATLTREMLSQYLEIIGVELDRGNTDPLPIAMSLYMLGKPTMAGAPYIASIRQSYEREVRAADLLVLIGVRPILTDNHLFDPILARTQKTVVVGGQGDELELLKTRSSGEVIHIANTFGELVEKGLLEEWVRKTPTSSF